jgi:aminopeptidase YwaD
MSNDRRNSMSHAHRAGCLVAALVLAVAGNLAGGCGSKETVNRPLASHSPALITETSVKIEPAGRVVSGPSNLRQFAPAETGYTPVVAEDVNLRQVFEDLGPDARLWYQHVQTLANPFFEGREPETHGAAVAADYVEFWLSRYGLEPAFAGASSYRQPFDYIRRSRYATVTVEAASVSIGDRALTRGTDFVVLGSSGSGTATGPVSFVGYGIADGPDGYTSFDDDTDLTGRIALLLRYAPLSSQGERLWDERQYRRQAALMRKMRNVTRRGAAAVLLVSAPGDPESGPLEPIDRSRPHGPGLDVPAVQITPAIADEILRRGDPEGRDLQTWRRLADAGEVTTVNLDDALTATVSTSVDRYRQEHQLTGQNVGGVLRGTGALADQWVVIGAHYDHVGVGTYGGVMPNNRGLLHPGADDNASGTAGVLVLAKRFTDIYRALGPDGDLRSVLFVTFDAEEMGLHGSRYFVDNPPIDLARTSIMLNMDMIGRLRSRNLSVLGTGTAEGLPELLQPLFESSGLTVSVMESGSGRSDESAFQRHDVPGLHFFTGMTKEYTTPADQAWTLNPGGAVKVLDLVEAIAVEAATRPEQLVYRQPAPGPGRDRGYAPVRLGIRPGMDEDLDFGVLVDEVYEGTSAAEGGILPGDVMVAWDGVRMDSARDLFENLQLHEPGDTVTITVLRNGEQKDLKVTLQAGRRRSED